MRFQCPACGEVVAVENSDAGTMVQCGSCQQIIQVPSERVAPGVVIGDFIIEHEIGRGGMGVVYLTHQISLDRPAALKILSDNYANNNEFVVGFIKEARAAAKLNHPNIVQAYAVGDDEGVFYFAMENIDGETMKQVLKREGVIPVEQALSIIQQIAEGLNYAWQEQKLIHRDIKPDNIMLTSNGRAKLADLGLARVAGDIDDSEEEEIMGTPQYISPEHLTGAPMDTRSDIYSLGATFYHFVTGRFPFQGNSGAEIAKKHLTDPLVPACEVNSDIPVAVSKIISRMMAKNPSDRYQDEEELIDDLRNARHGKEPEAMMLNTADLQRPLEEPGTGAKKLTLGKKGGGKKMMIKKDNSATGTVQKSQTKLMLKNQHQTSLNIPVSEPVPESENLDSTNDIMTSTGTQTGSTVDVSKKTPMGKKQKMIIAGAGGGTALLIVIGIVIALLLTGKGGDEKKTDAATGTSASSTSGKTEAAAGTETASPYLEEMEKILKYFKDNPQDIKGIYDQCEDLKLKNPPLESAKEKEKMALIEKLFLKVDALLAAPARKDAEVKYEELLAGRKHDFEMKEAEKKRIAAETDARQRAQEARKRAAETKALELKEEAEKLQEELAKEKKYQSGRFMSFVMSGNLEQAEKNLDTWMEKLNRISSHKEKKISSLAAPMKSWVETMKSRIATAKTIEEAYRNMDDLKMQIPVGDDLYVINKVEKGVAYAKCIGTGKQVKFSISRLPERQRSNLLKHAVESSGNESNLYIYFLMKGDLVQAKKNADGDEAKKEVSELIKSYFQYELSNENLSNSKRKELRRKYKHMKEFKEVTAASASSDDEE